MCVGAATMVEKAVFAKALATVGTVLFEIPISGDHSQSVLAVGTTVAGHEWRAKSLRNISR
jgi:hypothetical protein